MTRRPICWNTPLVTPQELLDDWIERVQIEVASGDKSQETLLELHAVRKALKSLNIGARQPQGDKETHDENMV